MWMEVKYGSKEWLGYMYQFTVVDKLYKVAVSVYF